ncbi:hypothetical protein SH449x_000344 [Pirellulaceae bacterium SH449]
MKSPSITSFVAILLIATLCTGCGSSLNTEQVTGTITLNGKPLELIHVEFWSTEGPRSIGKTDESGNFFLELDDRTMKGAVIGTHKVMLRDTWPMKDDYLSESGEWVDKSDGKRPRIHSKYYDVSTTPLSFTVKPGEKNHYDIEALPRQQ